MKTLVVSHVMKVLCSLVVTLEHVRVMEVGVVMIPHVRVSNFYEHTKLHNSVSNYAVMFLYSKMWQVLVVIKLQKE